MAKTITITVHLYDATLQEVISNTDMSEQKGDYYKLKVGIELLKSSRSDSASFCTGVSTNGNIGWVDSRGRTFKEVFPK